LASKFGSALIKAPTPGTENDDHNPQRIQPRSLFDLAVGDDNLFHGDSYKWSLCFTVVNLVNKLALYNFLSTCPNLGITLSSWRLRCRLEAGATAQIRAAPRSVVASEI
jgi:hypothetical protein